MTSRLILQNPIKKKAVVLWLWLLITIWLLCILSCSSTGTTVKKDHKKVKVGRLSFDRSTFGNSSLQFWYSLTAFEINALSNTQKAKQGDPDALFALAIMASGNVRDKATYTVYHNRVLGFVNAIRPAVIKAKTVKEKGEILYDGMCQEFFKQRITDNALKGYRFGQSQLTEVFRTAKFNCVSSSMLYIVLARYFGFTVKGVNIPSHIFVQLEVEAGKMIEIETTIKSGYDIIHDKAFYKKQGKDWFSLRNLPPSSYEDYLKRQLLEPYEVVCFNMNNQHTAAGTMPEFDRNRLLEAMGFINTKDSYSQDNRLIVYNNEFNYLNGVKDFETLGRMFEKIKQVLPEVRKKWSTDPEVLNHLLLIEYEYAYTLLKTNRAKEGLALLDPLLASLNPTLGLYKDLVHNSVSIIGSYSNQLIEDKKFNACLTLLNSYNEKDILHNKLDGGYCFLFESWATDQWKKAGWPQTVAKYKQALAFTRSAEDSSRIYGNIEGAYCNWAVTNARSGKKTEARKVLNKCVRDIPEAKDCKKSLRQLKR